MVDIRLFEYFTGSGSPVVGATVDLRVASLTQPNVGVVVASTTTNANGMWQVLGLSAANDYDVTVTYSGRVRKQFGLAVNILGFSLVDADIDASADILLSKIDGGWGGSAPIVDTRSPLAAPFVHLADSLSAVFTQLKNIVGTSWDTAPGTTLPAVVTSLASLWLRFHDTTGHTHAASGTNAPKLAQANTHQSADTDSAATALHHTLGAGANQAATGNHGHTALTDHIVDVDGVHGVTGGATVLGAIDQWPSPHSIFIQAGRATTGAGATLSNGWYHSDVTVTFPVAFPTALISVVAVPSSVAALTTLQAATSVWDRALSGCSIRASSPSNVGSWPVDWIAIGY